MGRSDPAEIGHQHRTATDESIDARPFAEAELLLLERLGRRVRGNRDRLRALGGHHRYGRAPRRQVPSGGPTQQTEPARSTERAGRHMLFVPLISDQSADSGQLLLASAQFCPLPEPLSAKLRQVPGCFRTEFHFEGKPSMVSAHLVELNPLGTRLRAVRSCHCLGLTHAEQPL